MNTRKISLVIAMLVILSLALTGTGLAQEDVQTAADAYFSGGTQNVAAADLFDVLNDGDESNDPVVIDLRSPDDYALGHIPGAMNVGVKGLFTEEQLAELEGKDVVTYCYTGQTSSQATSALNMLGIPAKSMLYGFPAWANVADVSVAPFDAAVDQNDYKVSDEAIEATEEYDPATPLGDTVAAAVTGYFPNGTKNIKASALFDNLNDGDTSNDPFMIDVRAPEDYAAGHIPGAVNIGAKALFTAENLGKIPTDTPVVVNCYSGQTASQVTSVLNMLGYDASNLKFGLASWSPTGVYKFNAADSPNYRYEGTGEVAGEMAMEEAATEAPAEEAAPVAEAAPAAAPEALPATGGVPFDFTWLYLLFGSGLLGTGLYLKRR